MKPLSRWGVGIGGVTFLLGLAAQAPLRLAVDHVVSPSNGRLLAGPVEGPWHNGRTELVCNTLSGRRLNCGRYQVKLAWTGFWPGLNISATDGGQVRLRSASAGGLDLRELKLPAAVLGLIFPFAEQARMGGDLSLTGRFVPYGSAELDVRWRGEIGEFPVGEQTLKIRSAEKNQGYVMTWTPSATLPRLDGSIICDQQGHCRGEIHLQIAEDDVPFNNFLATTGENLGHSRYRYRIDAK